MTRSELRFELAAIKTKFFGEDDWRHCGMGCGRCVQAHRALKALVVEVERLTRPKKRYRWSCCICHSRREKRRKYKEDGKIYCTPDCLAVGRKAS